MSAAWAVHDDPYDPIGSLPTVRSIVRTFAAAMSSSSFYLRDLTLPITSYFTGEGFNRAVVGALGAAKIEDSVTPFFCVTTDLHTSSAVVHRSGAEASPTFVTPRPRTLLARPRGKPRDGGPTTHTGHAPPPSGQPLPSSSLSLCSIGAAPAAVFLSQTPSPLEPFARRKHPPPPAAQSPTHTAPPQTHRTPTRFMGQSWLRVRVRA